jgi:hypothetical protein
MYPIAKARYFTATALWGQNATQGNDASNSALAEATIKLKKLAVYARYEWVQKTAEELVLSPVLFVPTENFNINQFTAGLSYDLLELHHTRFALGGQFTLFHTNEGLNALYGKNPASAELYLHIYPGLLNQ